MLKEDQMKTKPTEKRAAQDEAGNLQDMRRFHDVFEICHPPAGKSLPSGIRQPVAAESASASILQPVAGESGKRLLVDFSNIPTCWRKTLHEPGRADLPVSPAARQRRPTGFMVPMHAKKRKEALDEPSEAPQGFGLRQPSGALDRCRQYQAVEGHRSPRRYRANARSLWFKARIVSGNSLPRAKREKI